jgi:hypothetical protein
MLLTLDGGRNASSPAWAEPSYGFQGFRALGLLI